MTAASDTSLYESDPIRLGAPSPAGRRARRGAAEAPAPERPDAPPRPPRVLIVEDDPSHADVERRLLSTELAAEVEVAGSGSAALDAIEALRFDLVLVDFRLPDMDGLEFLRLLREREQALPAVVLTAAGSESIAVRAMKEGAADYLPKDFSARGVAELVRAVRGALAPGRLARAYERARELFEETYEQTWDGIAYVDLETGRVISANAALGRLVGRVPKDIEGRSFEDLVHPEDRAEFRRLLAGVSPEERERAEGGKGARRAAGDARLLGPRGEAVEAEMRLVQLALGPDPAALLTVRDLTERRRLEEELQRARRMEALELLAGGIAHEFNNRLAVILGYAAMLRGIAGADPARRATAAEAIEEAAQTAAELTRRLLAFGRGAPGRREALEPAVVVERVLRLVEPTLGRAISIEASLAADLPRVLGDPAELEQVLLDLVFNARDAIGDRAGRIVVEGARTEAGGVRLTVRDTGTGIAAAVRDRMFDPFFTTKDVGRGTGLGLSIAYAIVRRHRGQIEVESEVGKGSAFHVILPPIEGAAAAAVEGVRGRRGAGDDPASRDREATIPEGAEGQGALILVVDDEPLVRRVIADTLADLGYRALLASSGEEALAIVQSKPARIEAAIVDLLMPGMSGIDLLHRLAAIRRDLPVIATSGHAPPGALERLEALGARGFLRKPFSAADAAKALGRAIAAARTRAGAGASVATTPR